LFVPGSGFAVLSSRIIDVSTGGVGLMCPSAVVIGGCLLLQSPTQPFMNLYRVVRCRPMPGGPHLVGAQLLRRLNMPIETAPTANALANADELARAAA
jgi:hypothetical protein